MKNRSKLPRETLKAYGYGDKEIEMLKNFKDTEEEVTALSPSVYMYYDVVRYEWLGNTELVSSVDFNWYWNYKPIFDLGTDIFGIGWSDDMRLDRNHSYHRIKYKDVSSGNHRVAEYVLIDLSGLTNSAKSTFKLQKSINGWICWLYEDMEISK